MLNKYIPPRFMQQVDALLSKLRSCEAREKANEKRTEREKENLPPIPPIKGKRRKAGGGGKKEKREKENFYPSVDTVQKYLDEQGITNVSGQRFVEWYTENGWRTSKGEPIRNWKLVLNGWIDRENRNEKKRQPRGAQTTTDGTGADRVAEFTTWLDAEFPLPGDKDATIVSSFMAKYAAARWPAYSTIDDIKEAIRVNTPSMKRLPKAVGMNALMCVLCSMVEALADSAGTDHRHFRLDQVKDTAQTLLETCGHLSMPEMIFAYNRIKQGEHGSFKGRFTHDKLMESIKDFKKWRREYYKNNNIL